MLYPREYSKIDIVFVCLETATGSGFYLPMYIIMQITAIPAIILVTIACVHTNVGIQSMQLLTFELYPAGLQLSSLGPVCFYLS